MNGYIETRLWVTSDPKLGKRWSKNRVTESGKKERLALTDGTLIPHFGPPMIN